MASAGVRGRVRTLRRGIATPRSARGNVHSFEALSWAASLEERERPHNEPLLWAIRYARDRVTHGWAEALEGRERPTARVMRAAGHGMSRLVVPPVVWDWFWRDVRELPPVPESHRTASRDEQKKLYTELAGKPARAALEDLERLFAE